MLVAISCTCMVRVYSKKSPPTQTLWLYDCCIILYLETISYISPVRHTGYRAIQKTRAARTARAKPGAVLRPNRLRYNENGMTKHMVLPPSSPDILIGRLRSSPIPTASPYVTSRIVVARPTRIAVSFLPSG